MDGRPGHFGGPTGSGLQAGSFAPAAALRRYPDSMSTDEVTAPQASIAGPFARLFFRFNAIACWLFIAFWPAMLVFDQVEQPWWGATLTIAGFVLLMGLLGSWMWYEANRARDDTERLLRAGRD